MQSLPTVPLPAEFATWPEAAVRPLTQGKTVVFAPGGTSRWYFLEHGGSDTQAGYGASERFRDYGRRALSRIVELVDVMLNDGVGTVLVVGFVPGQDARDENYNRNLSWAFEVLVDEQAQELYARYQLSVLFRGGWKSIFDRVGASALPEKCQELERRTASEHPDRSLIWLTSDEAVIPDSLIPLVIDSLERTGALPGRAALSTAYYGRDIQQVDILIGNNKPSVEGLAPPLLTLGDAYFTVSPTLYMDRALWRSMLYDHLFARRGNFRDYTKIQPSAMQEMKAYYQANREAVLGLGSRHAPTQTWRPAFWPNLDHP